MKRINLIGERAEYFFENLTTGERIMELGTVEDYRTRFFNGGQPNPPQKAGYKHIGGGHVWFYDTPDGFIHTDEYCVFTDIDGFEKVLFGVADRRAVNIRKEDVSKIALLKNGGDLKLSDGRELKFPKHFTEKVASVPSKDFE
jgi:hypothetical protein